MINLLEIPALIAFIIRAISMFIIAFSWIPLQLKEARVKNGLKQLRVLLLILGINLFLTNALAMYLIFYTLFYHKFSSDPMAIISQIVNSLLFLSIAFTGYIIYHTQYSEQNKERHHKIDKMEEIKST